MGPGVYVFHSAALPGVYLSPCVYLSPALKRINMVAFSIIFYHHTTTCGQADACICMAVHEQPVEGKKFNYSDQNTYGNLHRTIIIYQSLLYYSLAI